jgi:hypothetical protein
VFDSDPNTGGGASADIAKEVVYEKLRASASCVATTRGHYRGAALQHLLDLEVLRVFFIRRRWAAVRAHPHENRGMQLPAIETHRAELARANDVVDKMCALLHLTHHAGTASRTQPIAATCLSRTS